MPESSRRRPRAARPANWPGSPSADSAPRTDQKDTWFPDRESGSVERARRYVIAAMKSPNRDLIAEANHGPSRAGHLVHSFHLLSSLTAVVPAIWWKGSAKQ